MKNIILKKYIKLNYKLDSLSFEFSLLGFNHFNLIF